MVMKKSGRGSVGKEFRKMKRVQEDEEYRKKRKEIQRNYYQNNREKIRKLHKDWHEKLTKFANKRCKKCDKLLNHKTESGFCWKHIWTGRKKNERN